MNKTKVRYGLLFIVVLLVSQTVAHAQADHQGLPDHTPMMNETWEIINQLMYKVEYEDKAGEPTITPLFPDALKALQGNQVSLQGYLVPIASSRTHQRFMLSVLPIFQCMFCGQGEIPPMVEVVLAGEPIPFTEVPLIVNGEVYLNSDTSTGAAEIQLHHAIAQKKG